MKDNKWNREEIVRVGGTEVVYAKETESPDYWLLGDNGEQYGIFGKDLEDTIEVLKTICKEDESEKCKIDKVPEELK